MRFVYQVVLFPFYGFSYAERHFGCACQIQPNDFTIEPATIACCEKEQKGSTGYGIAPAMSIDPILEGQWGAKYTGRYCSGYPKGLFGNKNDVVIDGDAFYNCCKEVLNKFADSTCYAGNS